MQFCSKCGAQIVLGNKFCTKCGQPVPEKTAESVTDVQESSPNTQPVPVQSAGPSKSIEYKKLANGYWQWLISSIKRPDKVTDSHQYNGLISLIVETFLLSFAMTQLIDKILSVFSSSSVTGLLLKWWLFLLIGSLAMVGVSLIAQNVLTKTNENYWIFLNRVTNYSNVLILVDIILTMLVLVSLGTDSNSTSSDTGIIAGILLIIALIIWIAALFKPVLLITKGHYDTIYASVVVSVVDLIICELVIRLIGNDIVDLISTILSNLF